MADKVVIGNATLYLGDCMDILPTLPKVDAVITDPPYGIGLDYGIFQDTPDAIKELAPRVVELSKAIAPLVSITPGNVNHYLYPQPTWTLCWFNRAGAGSGPWGFSCWQPILCYGADPYLASGKGRRADYIEWSEPADKNGHPCPKPALFMQRWIERVSHGNSVCDPFMGSGTTGVAAIQLGRSFIGIELEPKYFDIACKRIEQAVAQGQLFAPEPVKQVQEGLL